MDHHAHGTVGSSFFDQLWPLILDENVCDIEGKDHEVQFIPEQPFHQMHWHRFLSIINFPNYKRPIKLRCCGAVETLEQIKEHEENEAHRYAKERADDRGTDIMVSGSVCLKSINKQINDSRAQHEHRQKLAYEFANRKYPWTMQHPSHEKEFEIDDELRQCFKSELEMEILQAIQNYDCKLMIIDAGTEVCFDAIHRWVKFRPYVQMLVLVRCPRVERHIHLMDGIFKTLMIEEDIENTWHQELNCSLRAGLRYAKENNMHKNCASAFIFVFGKQRGYCDVDTFKILRSI